VILKSNSFSHVLVLLIFCVEQIGSTLFKLAVVTTQQADEMVAEKSGKIEEARTAYERAEDMLRQAIRYLGSHLEYNQVIMSLLGYNLSSIILSIHWAP
jgi:hypothetical protein